MLSIHCTKGSRTPACALHATRSAIHSQSQEIMPTLSDYHQNQIRSIFPSKVLETQRWLITSPSKSFAASLIRVDFPTLHLPYIRTADLWFQFDNSPLSGIYSLIFMQRKSGKFILTAPSLLLAFLLCHYKVSVNSTFYKTITRYSIAKISVFKSQ